MDKASPAQLRMTYLTLGKHEHREYGTLVVQVCISEEQTTHHTHPRTDPRTYLTLGNTSTGSTGLQRCMCVSEEQTRSKRMRRREKEKRRAVKRREVRGGGGGAALLSFPTHCFGSASPSLPPFPPSLSPSLPFLPCLPLSLPPFLPPSSFLPPRSSLLPFSFSPSLPPFLLPPSPSPTSPPHHASGDCRASTCQSDQGHARAWGTGSVAGRHDHPCALSS